MKRRILVADDDVAIREMLALSLAKEGYAVEAVASLEEVKASLKRKPFDLIVSDIYLNRDNGLDILRHLREGDGVPPIVILITAHGTVETAARAHAEGAFDYIAKPFGLDALLDRVRCALTNGQTPELESETPVGLESMIVGNDAAIVEVYKAIARVAPLPVPVLVLGESGTGKELVARALHRFSPRTRGPFVAVNCGSLPPGLLGSELFGHRRGAFTDAHADRRGAIEQAKGGTLFLDEIGETSSSFQVDLLRFLQEGEYRPVGGDSSVRAEVRVLAATNRDLRHSMRSGAFREDLYYRLAVYEIFLPPLRARLTDLALLVEHFRVRFEREFHLEHVPGPSEAVLQRLRAHSWPGNVRELENVVQRAIIDTGGLRDLAAIERFLSDSEDSGGTEIRPGDRVTLRQIQRRHIELVLARCGGHRTRAAEILGIERKSLYRMARRLQIDLDASGTSEEEP